MGVFLPFTGDTLLNKNVFLPVLPKITPTFSVQIQLVWVGCDGVLDSLYNDILQ